jgi:hypothetical protein
VTTTHENRVPRPVIVTHWNDVPSQKRHCSLGYQQHRPHWSHRGMRTSLRAAPAQNSRVGSQVVSGSGKSGRMVRFYPRRRTSVAACGPVYPPYTPNVASGTWAAAWPRSWRTTSTTWAMPST